MVKRDLYLNRISSLIDKDIIKIIVGVRRCGKSYMFNLIIEELLKRGIDKENILLINFESAKYRNVSNPRELDLLVGDLTKTLMVRSTCSLMKFKMLTSGKSQSTASV